MGHPGGAAMGSSCRFTLRSDNVAVGFFSGSKISITPFSIVITGGCSLSFGSGNSSPALQEPSARRVTRSVGRCTAKCEISSLPLTSSRKSVLQKTNISSTYNNSACGPVRAWLENRQPANLDPLARD